MTTNEAREYFKNKGLTYDNINIIDFTQLCLMVNKYLQIYRTTTEHAKQMNMRLATMKKKDSKFEGDKLKYAFLKIDGSNFKDREGISFQNNGFIGFCGEFSTVNTEPILQAFIKWCDELAEIKTQQN